MHANSSDQDPIREESSVDFHTLAVDIQFYSSTVILVAGLIGNTLSILVNCLPHNRNNVMCFYLRNLAVFDALVLATAFLQPSTFASPPYGQIYCIVFYYFEYVFWNCSMWTIFIIAVDRVIVVRYPLHAARWCTLRRARIYTAFLFVFECGFYVGNLYMSAQYHQGPHGVYLTCVLPDSLRIYFIVEQIISQPVPILGVCALNVTIAVSLKRHKRKMSKITTTTTAQNMASQNSKDNTMTLMLMLVATFLVLLLFPFFLDAITWYFLPDLAQAQPDIRYLSFVIILVPAQCNNAINFFLYCIGSKYFRRDLVALVLCRFKST